MTTTNTNSGSTLGPKRYKWPVLPSFLNFDKMQRTTSKLKTYAFKFKLLQSSYGARMFRPMPRITVSYVGATNSAPSTFEKFRPSLLSVID